TVADLVEGVSRFTGRMASLPDWAFGTWLGVQGGIEKVTKATDDAVAAGNPVTAVWIQDWVGRRMTSFGSQLWWRWQPDEDTYPNIKSFAEKLNARGIKLLGYVNPF